MIEAASLQRITRHLLDLGFWVEDSGTIPGLRLSVGPAVINGFPWYIILLLNPFSPILIRLQYVVV